METCHRAEKPPWGQPTSCMDYEAILAEAGITDQMHREEVATTLRKVPHSTFTNKRATLELLKRAGLAKLGQRQKASSLLFVASQLTVIEPTQSVVPVGDELWLSVTSDSLAATVAVGLPQSSAAEEHLVPPSDQNDDETPADASQDLESIQAGKAIDLTEKETMTATGDIDKATGGIDRQPIVSFQDRSPEEKGAVYRQCGNDAFGKGDLSSAEQFYQKALEVLPEQPEILSNLAACALAANPPQPGRALALLDRVFANQPHHMKARLRAGRCCLMLAQLESALEHFQIADAAANAAKSASEQIGAQVGSQQVRFLEQAREGLATVRRLFSQIERCLSLSSAGRCDDAIAIAREVENKCVAAPLGALLVVRSLLEGGRLAEARSEADVCVLAYPSDLQIQVTLARVMARSGQVDEAERALALVLERQPDCTEAQVALTGIRSAIHFKGEGNAAYGRGEYDAAEKAYSEALTADIGQMLKPVILGNRAQAKLQAGRPVGALVDCSEALELDSSNVKLLLRRAACRLALESPEQARRDYERVLELQPDNPTATQCLLELPISETAESAPGVPEAEEDEINPYKELGVDSTASYSEIKKAFRELSLKLHPDKYTGEALDKAEEKFQRVRKAAAILTDKWKRLQLDEGFATMDDLVKQYKADNEFVYYATTRCLGGCTRDTEDDRRYDPFKKPSKEFSMNPLRHNPHVQEENHTQLMQQQGLLPGGPPIQLMDKSQAHRLR